MGIGLQVFNAQGDIQFDSQICMGGVCLGIIAIPVAGATYVFPAMPNDRAGKVIFADTSTRTWTYDTALGYPRFIFTAGQGTRPTYAGLYIL